jgi:lipopolysaccharide export system protein LptA
MRKRLGLFVIGFILALSAFWLYRLVTGATELKPPPRPPNQYITQSARGHTFEIRDRVTGELQYIIQSKDAKQISDEKGNPLPGHYNVVEPSATVYMKDGRILHLQAGKCFLILDQLPKAPKVTKGGGTPGPSVDLGVPQVRVARMSDNVMLTISAKPSEDGAELKPQDGKVTVAFDGEVEVFQNQNLLTSPGAVHVRSDIVDFDGEGLNLSYNKDEKRIEFLRIDKGDTVILRGVGNDAFSLDTTKQKKPVAAKTPAAAKLPVAVAPGLPGANPKATTKPSFTATAYKISFQNVTASVGNSKLTAAALYALFMPGVTISDNADKPAVPPAAPDAAPAINLPAANAPVDVAPPALAADPKPANFATTKRAVATTRPDDPRAPYAPAGPDDLVVHWVGPMEMRPAGPKDLKLTGNRDSALEAVGTAENPVKLEDTDRIVTAGRLWYHTAADRIEIEPGVLKHVQMADGAQGMVRCQGVSFVRGTAEAQLLKLLGPGTIEVPQVALKRDTKPGPNSQPLLASWKKTADVYFAMDADPKKPTKKSPSIRRAVLTGDVEIKDPTFEMAAQTLDFKIVPTGDPKNPQSLESMIATGKVNIKYAREGGSVDAAGKPDGMTAGRLELFTSPRPGSKVLMVSRMLATEDVVAWNYTDRNEVSLDATKATTKPAAGSKLVRQTIYTAKLDVAIEAKEKTAIGTADNVSDGLAGIGMKSLTASDGVKVELEGLGGVDNQTVIATAHTLSADPKNGKAILEGDIGVNQKDGVPKLVQIQQGDNHITGEKVILDQKSHSIEIPGPGMFSFLEKGKNGEPDGTVQIDWSRSMLFDNKAMRGRFSGLVHAKLLGKPDQTSELSCKDFLEVVLASSKSGAEKDDKADQLKSLIAKGDVRIAGSTFEPGTKKVLTSILMANSETRYDGATKTLEIPGKGSVAIEDYRVEQKPPAKNATVKTALNKKDGPDSKGLTAFKFDDGLIFIGDNGKGDAGSIRMKKNVVMLHYPTKPFNLPGDPSQEAVKEIRLQGDSLAAQLAQSKEKVAKKTVSSPLALGSGNTMDLSRVIADGNARLSLGASEVSGLALDFDVAKYIATVRAGKGVDAQVVRPGEAMVTTKEDIVWNLQTNEFKLPATTIRIK